ncbi:MAG TPA: sigma-70 family RNA polymerase sigma factor [Bryobacteraceae bacterium]|nr:sigma-70 family RNA polymerase sigma factor [Bryobacteraceae bacterium]
MIPSDEMYPLDADAELVAQTRRGDGDAFGRIVARYQALICALAYNVTGSVARSEDLAQEAFVVAWTQLPGLREPEKLRSWLCGIVRNLGRRARRAEAFEPVLRAEPLETSAPSLAAPEPGPLDQAISREEEAILWRQMEAIPETYREVLILYYRQHSSIEQVALALELSEEAVRQRLTRGRRLLQEQVLAFVENALERTSPKPEFTRQVLAALPAASSGKAIGAGLAAASGSAAKGAWAAAGPLGAVFAMLGGVFVSRRALAADDNKSAREGRFVARFAWVQVALAAAFLGIAWIMMRRESHASLSPFLRDIGAAAFIFLFWVAGMGLWRFRFRRQFRIQREDNTIDETEWGLPLRGARVEPNPSRPVPSFWLLFRRSALLLVFVAIMAFKAPWKLHFGLALGFYVAVPLASILLSTLLAQRMSKKRRRFERPPVGFLFGFPVAATLLLVDLDLTVAWDKGAASVTQIVCLNAAVVLAYAVWIRLFVRRGGPSVGRRAS